MENNRRGACQIAWPRKPHLCARGSCVAAHFADDGPGGHFKLLHLWPGQIPPPGAVGRVEL